MASDVEDILAAVRSLPPREQQEVLRRLAESLVPDETAIDRANETFWMSRSIDEIIREQHIAPIDDLRTLALSDWPEDESVDAFLEYVYGQRRADRDA
ncbi:MAG TPA: hypothetical protein VGF38_14710 [Ktedonobacterales bacterium]|jgi:hypothetical protein